MVLMHEYVWKDVLNVPVPLHFPFFGFTSQTYPKPIDLNGTKTLYVTDVDTKREPLQFKAKWRES